jgi:hypothetical protein
LYGRRKGRAWVMLQILNSRKIAGYRKTHLMQEPPKLPPTITFVPWANAFSPEELVLPASSTTSTATSTATTG